MQTLTNLIVNHPAGLGLTLAGVIVVVGLFIYGFGDLMKFAPRRVWAISGVVFRESIRRKVLWLTPIVMLAIVALTGIQQPEDELDAIRQTLQFSMFASGLLVVITGVMLSCTNLPRDIETKVIFTIVTKPTTRFEIILGKIVGFARVTGSILILMGLFTWSYSHLRAWKLQGDIAATLSQPMENEFARERLRHHQREGLLDTRNLATAEKTEVYARPIAKDSTIRWFSTQQTAATPFLTEQDEFIPQGFHDPAAGEAAPAPGAAGMKIVMKLYAEQIGKIEIPQPQMRGPMLPDPELAANPYGKPGVYVSIMDSTGEYDVVGAGQINNGQPYTITPGSDGSATILVELDEKIANLVSTFKLWHVVLAPSNENFLIGVQPGAVMVAIPGKTDALHQNIKPAYETNNKPSLTIRGGSGRSGRLLEGPSEHFHPIAVTQFRDVHPKANRDGTVGLELRMDIERLGDDADVDTTTIEVTVANANGSTSEPIYLTPEKNKIIYADVPVAAFEGGTFDVQLRTITQGHAISLTSRSVSIVESRHWFGSNLAKALFTQWMLSVLVVSIGTCCSTFLSWPIAIVLNVVALMARWAVDQVSDSLQPGIGALLATDMSVTNATQARVISTTFDSLARLLNFVSQFLPNIDHFSTTDLVQRGLLIPMSSVGSAAIVLAVFGLPLLTLSYIFLRRSEVAP